MSENVHTKRKPAEDFLSVKDLWHLCKRNWNWFIISLIVCIAGAAFYLYRTPDLFTREAAILVKEETLGKTKSRNTSGEDFSEMALVQQQTNVSNVVRQLSSLRVLSEVARRMKMGQNERDFLHAAMGLQRRFKASIDNEKSTVINLQFVDNSPERAEEVLETLIRVYNEQWLEERNKVAASTSRFIDERLSVMEKDLGVVDDSISSFKARHRITDLAHVSDVYLQQQSSSEAEILRLNNQKGMAEYVLQILRDKSARDQLLPTNSGLNNMQIERQIADYNDMLLQLKNNRVGTSTQNPRILRQEQQLEEMRQNILTSVSGQIKTIDIQLQKFYDFSGEASSKIASNPAQAKHLVSVEREQKVKESLYLYLLQKKEENEISMTYTSFNTEVVDMPHGSDLPTSPNRMAIWAAACLAGLFLPAFVIFVRENLNTTVRSKQDITRVSNLSVVGEIPFFGEKRSRIPFFRKRTKGGSHHTPIVIEFGKQNWVNEAFRLLRTNLEFMANAENSHNVYIVSSFYASSGKTFVSINLAVVMALKGWRVLLIDGDFRRASASRSLHCPRVGIADYLGGKEVDLESLKVVKKAYPTLHILPVGTIPPNPTELLSSEGMKELIDRVRREYDYVIVDCPPSDNLADSNLMERYADRTLYIVRAGVAERSRIPELEAEVESGRYKHLSIILNAVDPRRLHAYKDYYYYYYGHQN